MAFSLVMPAGGDGSKIARLGGWQSGGGAFFHSLTVASALFAAALGLRVGFAQIDVDAVFIPIKLSEPGL